MTNGTNLTPQVVSFSYLNNPIRFSINGCVMINATNMAKPFKKNPIDFLKTQRAKNFINSFSVMKKIITADLVKVIQGGTPQMQGTWMHEDVALEFARWLSSEFAIWCNDRIKEILQNKQPSQTEYDDLIKNCKYWKEQANEWHKTATWWAKQAINECRRTVELAERLFNKL